MMEANLHRVVRAEAKEYSSFCTIVFHDENGANVALFMHGVNAAAAASAMAEYFNDNLAYSPPPPAATADDDDAPAF